jgi:hypothetical protein
LVGPAPEGLQSEPEPESVTQAAGLSLAPEPVRVPEERQPEIQVDQNLGQL